MLINSQVQGDRAVVVLEGRFDFNSHREFRECYEVLLAHPAVRGMQIDFDKVDYLDSSALGMLLLLREKAETQGKQVGLGGVRGIVKQVLEIANFDKLFAIR